MTHPLIDQLRFTRFEWLRGLQGVSDEDGARHFGQMNCISWIVGHLAWHEQRYWLQRSQDKILFPQLNVEYAYGAPMSSPSLNAMLEMWQTVTDATNPFLDTLTTEKLLADLPLNGRSVGQTAGSGVRRVTYHYWYHIGEIQAIRQLIGQSDLPEYVGDIDGMAPYRPE